MSDFTTGSARERIDATEREQLQRSGSLLLDEQRRRPLYFEGRFLTAADLTRDQTYFLNRQAALNRASGFGVVQGLSVRQSQTGNQPDAFRVSIMPGCGVTPGGEAVVVPPGSPLLVNLADIGVIQALDATFGLSRLPSEPARSLSGLFVLGLRLVEFSANPIASYPTSVTEPRTVLERDGDIIEATAVTLIRYSELGNNDGLTQRKQVARQVFVEEAVPPLPVNVLPLAMIALNRGVIQWVDEHLVRRQLSSDPYAKVGLSKTPRNVRAAHAQQYDQHLRDVETLFATTFFSAASQFETLPAAGRLPKSGINLNDFSQTYFPAEMDIELTVIPTDEVSAILEDALLLPPIDLTVPPETFESMSILVMIPLTRQQLQNFRLGLSQATPTSTLGNVQTTRPLNVAAPGLIAKRKPIEVLQRLKLPTVPIVPINPQNLVDAQWRQALSQARELWYMRRRNVAYKAEITGLGVTLGGNARIIEQTVFNRLDALGVRSQFDTVQSFTSLTGKADMVAMLGASRLVSSDLLLKSAVHDLSMASTVSPQAFTGVISETTPEGQPSLDRPEVLKVAERFGDPRLGEGLARLDEVNPTLKENLQVADTLVQSGAVIELDKLARTLPAAELSTFSQELVTVSQSQGNLAAGNLIRQRLEGISR
jgi:hypothetical protein